MHIFEPISSIGSKKARAKSVTKELTSYILSIRVTCGDKTIVEESRECLQKLKSAFDYGTELQKQREIKAPQSTLLSRPCPGSCILTLPARYPPPAYDRGRKAGRLLEAHSIQDLEELADVAILWDVRDRATAEESRGESDG